MSFKVGFLNFNRDRSDQTGSARIRSQNLITYEPEWEEFVTGKKYDAVIFQKYYWHDYAKLYDGIKILDICDPDWLSGVASVDIVRFLEYMDGIVANTQATAEYILKICDKPVIVIPDRHDIAQFKQEKIHKGIAKSVIWFGYAHNAHVLKPYVSKLQDLGLELTIMSNEFKSVASYGSTEYKDHEHYVNWPKTLTEVNEELIRHDFVLLPSSRKIQDQYKSNNKSTHAWALGLPVAQWGDDIERFMDAEQRNKEKAEKMLQTRKDYDCILSCKEYKDFIWKLKNSK